MVRSTRARIVALIGGLSLIIAGLVGSGLLTPPPADSVAPRTRASSRPKPAKRKGWMRGMTVSAYGWGAAWATPFMYNSMKHLRSLGTNWISYHPYASIRNDGSINFSRSTNQPTVLKPLQYGRQLKMKMLLKPHIGYWRSKFKWRGAITFSKEAEWKRFFRDYTAWIVVQATMAQKGGADIFSMGCEFRKMLHRTKDWRKVIAAVRKVYKGKLTYSANWDSYQKVKFWDALDYIGIQAYFPLTKKPNPSEAVLEKAWKRVLKPIRAYAKKTRKPVIFTELGYNHASHTAARPWDHAEGGPHAAAIKRRCIKVALRMVPLEPTIKGVFLWKWFPFPWTRSHNYVLQYPAMKKILRNAWQ